VLRQGTRQAILELAQRGHSLRQIAKALEVSRGVVRRVIAQGSGEPPRIKRPEKAEPFRDRILELHALCRRNLVRVHEELVVDGALLSYAGLTAFCRRHKIGLEEKKPAGSYTFAPGQEMQHDTSAHDLTMGGKLRRVQTASLVLCHSRMLFFQFYPCFRRLECKSFLTEAIRYMQGACGVCMIDNTHVVVLRGTGKDMVPVPEMEAFARRLGFEFRAHEVGDANRSGRVERPFDFIENNFLAGREFDDWNDANRRARQWCDQVNATHKPHLRAKPRELFVQELPHLKPLPIYLPDPVEILHRVVDVEGLVSVDRNRYSVPPDLIGRPVEVHQSQNRIVIYQGGRQVAEHVRQIDPMDARFILAEHRVRRGEKPHRRQQSREEAELQRIAPEIAPYLSGMKKQGRLQTTLAQRRLLRMIREYPREPLLRAIQIASQYGLYDMERLESLILRHVAEDYFLLNEQPEKKGTRLDEP